MTELKRGKGRPKKEPQWYIPDELDPKDEEEYPAPPTHHIIKCRYCLKESRETIRWSRSCKVCRSTPSNYTRQVICNWDTWGDVIWEDN